MAAKENEFAENTNKISDYSNWMRDLPTSLHDVPVNSIAIPGTHNSFSFNLDINSEIVEADWIKVIVQLFGAKGRDILKKWSATQDDSFISQLTCGIRYFDLRTVTKQGTEDLYFVHGLLTCKTVEESLQEIATFLESHPKEIILLDFNHFYNMSEFIHKQFLSMILGILGNKMCPFLDTDSVTLNMLWESDLQVLVFYQHPVIESYLEFWPSSTIVSPWANTNNADKLLQYLEQNYKKGRSREGFYVTQGVLTPEVGDILGNLTGSLRDTVAAKINPSFSKWLKTKNSGPKGINICIMDFMEMCDYIPIVLQLNEQRCARN